MLQHPEKWSRLDYLRLVVWGGGAVKERGRLSPQYFCPPPSQVRGREEAGSASIAELWLEH